MYSSIALDGGSIKEADGCSQWFLSLRSVASGLEKPLLAGYYNLKCLDNSYYFSLLSAERFRQIIHTTQETHGLLTQRFHFRFVKLLNHRF